MKVYLVQMDVAWEDRPANFQKVHRLLDGRPIEEDGLIILPEMFATGFSMNIEATIEQTPSATEAFLVELARKKKSSVMAGLVTRGGGGKGRNECVVYDGHGNEIVRYRKLFPFTFGGESEHYERGANVDVVDVNNFKVAPFICYDLRFPEAFRVAASKGAEVITVIAQWPSRRTHHWVDLLKARAIENQAYVIGVNRCGSDPKLDYDGRSLVVDPHGNIVVDAASGECVVEAELNIDHVRAWRSDFPALRDMREDLLP